MSGALILSVQEKSQAKGKNREKKMHCAPGGSAVGLLWSGAGEVRAR